MTNDARVDSRAFVERFHAATEAAVAFAATMVRQALPPSRLYLIEPNASYDEHPLVGDEQLFPADSLESGRFLGPMPFDDAARWLQREGKVPEWVDVSVHDADRRHTYVLLICCGRFTSHERLLYYRDGLPPFGIKSPVMPPDWTSVDADGRFDLPGHWRGRLRRIIVRASWWLRSKAGST